MQRFLLFIAIAMALGGLALVVAPSTLLGVDLPSGLLREVGMWTLMVPAVWFLGYLVWIGGRKPGVAIFSGDASDLGD